MAVERQATPITQRCEPSRRTAASATRNEPGVDDFRDAVITTKLGVDAHQVLSRLAPMGRNQLGVFGDRKTVTSTGVWKHLARRRALPTMPIRGTFRSAI